LKWIQFANCPVIVTGVGVGPINYWFNFYYLRRILGLKGIQIQVRDSESYSIFRNLSLNNVTLNCDLVEGSRLDVFTNLYELNENYKMVLGCSIRPWGGLTVTSVKDLILRIVKEKSIDHIKFFVFEYADDNLSEYNFQIEIMRELGEISAEVVIYHGQLDFLKELGTVNFAVASRYHANIIWQKLNVPTIPIAYAPKVSSLYKKFGYKALTINEMLNNIVESDFISIALDSNYSFHKDLSSKLSLTFSSRMTFFFYDLLEFLGDIFVSAKSRLKIIGKS
jgi:polysaccharide pyruvyl transferase WcaK-like protein